MTPIQRIQVTDEWIGEYAQSIDAPIQTFQGKLIAPSTMPIIFWQFFEETSKQNSSPLLHGSQQFLYKEPITAGMILDCELALVKTEKKSGKSGNLTLFTYNLTCNCEGRNIVIATTTLIQVGASHEKIHHC